MLCYGVGITRYHSPKRNGCNGDLRLIFEQETITIGAGTPISGPRRLSRGILEDLSHPDVDLLEKARKPVSCPEARTASFRGLRKPGQGQTKRAGYLTSDCGVCVGMRIL